MKKACIFFFIFFASLLMILSSGAEPFLAEADCIPVVPSNPNNQEAALLPQSLLVIEDGAFEGTSLTRVDIPGSVTKIGDNAFANNNRLMMIRLWGNQLDISGDPFVGSLNVTMSGFADSDGITWAKKKGIRFALEAAFSSQKEVKQFISVFSHSLVSVEDAESGEEKTILQNKVKRTGRTNGELKAAAYDGVAALYIQSRYFP